MTHDPFENEIRVKKRSTFLTVLCILTFIGSGYGIINSMFTYIKADSLSEMILEAKKEINNDLNKKNKTSEESGFAGNVVNSMGEIGSPDLLRKTAVITFGVSVICLIGAILMWHLQKIGFYIYTAGTIAGIIASFYFLPDNFMVRASAGLQGFVGILFIIFYAMNLKSMNKAPNFAE